MDNDVIRAIASMVIVTLGTTSLGLLVAWIRARERAVRAEAQLAALLGGQTHATSQPSVVADRMQRLEQAVDSIAVDVERIAEAERFASKLLAERAPADRKRVESGRVITPH